MEPPHFVILHGADMGFRLAIHPGTGHVMGRHENTAYRINDPRCSRFHCEIRFENGTVTVIDQGGSGGTLVNGQKVTRQVLKHGDTLKIGDTLLRFRSGADDEAETLSLEGGTVASNPKTARAPVGDLAGQTLAHFSIGAVLGQGQSSVVFRATDTVDGKVVALKVMQPSFAKDDEERQRFIRAMTTMLPLQHPHLVRLYGAGKTGPYCWAALELVEGESLTEVIKRIGVLGMLDWKHSFRVAVHIGRALEYAHGQGIVHRAVAPNNILVRGEDKVAKLGDLMLAKALEGTLSQQVTKPGELIGDINYMSPERTRGQSEGVDGRSDQFSLGASLYALLTGKPPFAGASLAETILNIRKEAPVKPSKFQIGIPSSFEAMVLKLLAKVPDERFPTAAALVQDLERLAKFSGVQV